MEELVPDALHQELVCSSLPTMHMIPTLGPTSSQLALWESLGKPPLWPLNKYQLVQNL